MKPREYYENQIMDKLKIIPDDILHEFVNILDSINNITLQKHIDDETTKQSLKSKILSFAGAWSDFEEYDEFIEDIYNRRHHIN
jgi:hypothetical protein